MILLKLFRGRLNRRNWALGLLSSIVLLFTVLIIIPTQNTNSFLPNLVFPIFMISILVFNISLYVRRLHDIGKSGWFLLILLLPLINIFGFFYLAFKNGEDKDNMYGKKPLKEIRYPVQILGRN